MKVHFVNIDSRYPLSLMKLSAYHKKQGDKITDVNPDRVYVSCIFKEHASQARGIKTFYQGSDIFYGGPAFDNNVLPYEIEHTMPDYETFNFNFSMGRTTFGCIRNCYFCVVPKLEGKLTRHAEIQEFHDPKHDTVMLFDNNILADKECFFHNSDYLLDNKLKLIEHGMDIRLVDQDIATRLNEIKLGKQLHFAWDSTKDEEKVMKGIDILLSNGVKPYKLMFYTFIKDDLEDLRYRCKKLIDLGIDPFVMMYERKNQPKIVKDYARFVNKRIYKSCNFEDYK